MDMQAQEPAGSREITAAMVARAPRRIEGRDKVTGSAHFAGDLHADTLGFEPDVAVAVLSTQSTGRIASIDASRAAAAPGVRLVMTHENAPRLKKVLATNGNEIGDLLPMQDDRVHYAGQCVAVVVANTFENARDAAGLVVIAYDAPSNDVAFTLAQGERRVADVKKVGAGDPGQVKIGKPAEAFAAAAHSVDLTFETPPHHHNAMEPGAIVAAWTEDGGLTVHVPTQFSYGDAIILGQAFGFGLKERLPRLVGQVLGGFEFNNKVRVIATLSGGSFGAKNANPHLLIAPMAAKLNERPVKLVMDRRQVFTMLPFRPASRQRLRLAADADGRLVSIMQDALLAQGAKGAYVEPAGETVTKSYACPNILVHCQSARLDTHAPGWMRGPGACLGQFALDSAMDALADKMGIDPLEFRLRNHADVEPGSGHEWSSKSLKQCYAAAAERIGWHERDPRVGSMREGRYRVGYGMTSSVYPVRQLPTLARVILGTDGHARVQTAAHEIGQGLITSMTQLAAEGLGLPLRQVRLEWGDTTLPYGSMTVGSMSALSNGSSIAEAAASVKAAVIKRAVRDKASPLYGSNRHDIDVVDGRVGHPDGIGESVAALMARHPNDPITAEATTGRDFGRSKYGRQTFGAQFAKVLVDTETGHLKVERLIGAFAGGRPINPMLVRSQCLGGMIFGLGQALMEESLMDERTGVLMNRSLGEALVPTHADIPDLDAIVIAEDDTRAHPLGIKGMGEIGVIGTPAAIANAIHHATGVRLTTLPFRIDRVLAAA